VRQYPHSIVLINRLVVSHHCTIVFGLSSKLYVTADAEVCNMTRRMSVSLVHGKFVVVLG